jgi:hypothetical protein
MLTDWCQEHEPPCEGAPVGTSKRFATGKGNPDKAKMVAAIEAGGFRRPGACVAGGVRQHRPRHGTKHLGREVRSGCGDAVPGGGEAASAVMLNRITKPMIAGNR